MSVSESHHSQQKIKLCNQIINDHFGSTAAAITAVLLARGRLATPQIVKFANSAPAASTGTPSAVGGAPAGVGAGVPSGGPLGIGGSSATSSAQGAGANTPTRISPATVEHTLLALIQHNCAWHVLVSNETGAAVFGQALKELHAKWAKATSPAEAASMRAGYQEYFEINPDEIVPRLRFGSYIGMAQDRFGSDAADIIQLILKHGKLQAKDICNKLSAGDTDKSRKIARLLLLLLHRTYIRPSLASSHISPRDKFIAYEVEGKLKRRGNIFTPKELRELKDNVAARIEAEERMEWEGGGGQAAAIAQVVNTAAQNGSGKAGLGSTGRLGIRVSAKAAASSMSRANKKRKLDATRSAAGGSKGPAGDDHHAAAESAVDDGMDEDALLARRGKLDHMNLTHPALIGCEVDMDIYLRLNYDRFDVHVRDSVVYQAVRAQYNTVTADVFRLFAQAGEFGDSAAGAGAGGAGVGGGGGAGGGEGGMSSVMTSIKDERSAPISLNALSINLPEGLNLHHGFPKRAFNTTTSSSSSSSKRKDKDAGGPSRAELIAEYAAVLSCAEDIAGASRKRRFLAPAYTAVSAAAGGDLGKGKGKANGDAPGAGGGTSSRPTSSKLTGAAGGGAGTTVSAGGTRVSNVYVVEYAEICARLKRAALKDVVGEKFGPAAVRVIGVLLEKGKLEEKYISKLGLLSLSHTRHICARLFESSLLGLQEVPKSNDRQPGRTFFLWYVDLPSAYAWLLEGMYQTLARLGERRGEELRRERALVNKVERTDVAASMTALLSAGEKAAWEALQESLARLAVAEQRVASEAFVLASLPGE
ncbi:unnamed protein product [Tilletia caries]|uniref:DNA-directed RNA polymerase III subunit RPC3 n=1 Tax=Tilletia caries TaxID=13290 RepID=A0ABN7IRE8_9BASI|nr:unnamed protein product [Tilletia caries]